MLRQLFFVDAGDAIQGEKLGVLSQGEFIVQIMNVAGYDVILTQTGTKFSSNVDGNKAASFGKLILAKDGTISTQL